MGAQLVFTYLCEVSPCESQTHLNCLIQDELRDAQISVLNTECDAKLM